MSYETHTITLYATTGQELLNVEAQFWIEGGNAMADEVYPRGEWVEATLHKLFLGGLELTRSQVVDACGEDGVMAAEERIAERLMED